MTIRRAGRDAAVAVGVALAVSIAAPGNGRAEFAPPGALFFVGVEATKYSVFSFSNGKTRRVSRDPSLSDREPFALPEGKQVLVAADPLTGAGPSVDLLDARSGSRVHLVDAGSDPVLSTTGGVFAYVGPPVGITGHQPLMVRQYVPDEPQFAAEFEASLVKTGRAGRPAWSPDGQQVAYLHRDLGETGYTKIRVLAVGDSDVETERTVPVSEQADPDSLAWSPDVDYLAYVGISDSGRARLRMINVVEGTDRVLRTGLLRSDNQVTFSPDGRELVYARQPTSAPSRLYAVNTLSGKERPLALPHEPSLGEQDPSWASAPLPKLSVVRRPPRKVARGSGFPVAPWCSRQVRVQRLIKENLYGTDVYRTLVTTTLSRKGSFRAAFRTRGGNSLVYRALAKCHGGPSHRTPFTVKQGAVIR